MAPKPWGAWGLLDKDLGQLPGYGKGAEDKARARTLLAEAGYGPSTPLKIDMGTRAIAIYLDFASYVVSELKQVGVEATLKQIETAQWFPALARRDYQIGANLTAAGIDDPDAFFYENYRCGSSRNYTDYCSEELDRLIDRQSQELDRSQRLKLVWEIQRKLEADVARPMLGWRKEYFTQWPHVRNLVPHHSLYNYGRMQEVWLDR
jgi:peptide/nickel transport system substrate-binding protein